MVIQFYDYDGGLVHTYKDPSSEFKLRITIKDTPKRTTVWTLIGVDEDNWWNCYVLVPLRRDDVPAANSKLSDIHWCRGAWGVLVVEASDR